MLNKFGPLSVCIDASENGFHYYSNGIYAAAANACTTKMGIV